MLKTILSLQIVRQVLGAAGGALLALALFWTYRAAAPIVTAALLPSEAAGPVADASATDAADLVAVADDEEEVDIFDPAFILGADEPLPPAPNPRALTNPRAVSAPVPAPVATPAPVPLQATVTAAPALPSAGLGLWLIAGATLLASVIVRGRRGMRTED